MTDQFFKNKEKFFDRWAPNYDCLLTTVFYQAVHRRMLEFVDLPGHSQVLDIGCGTGRLLNRLAAKFPTLKGMGLDLSSEMIRQARQGNHYHPRLIFIQGNAESLPFANQQFDAIFNTISFLHYPHPEQFFLEVSRVLNSQGHFYLADYAASQLSFFPFSPGGLKFRSLQQREQFAEEAGLICLKHHYLLGGVVLSIFAVN